MVRDEESDRLAEALEQMEAVSRTPAALGLGLGWREMARDGARWQPLGTPPAALHAHARHTTYMQHTCNSNATAHATCHVRVHVHMHAHVHVRVRRC